MKAQSKNSLFPYFPLVLFFFFSTAVVYAWLSAENKKIEMTPAQTNQALALAQDTALITNMQQLTFVGPRAGEGYFSKDGKKMIFQAERQDQNPFYQIYQMELKTGKTERISSGEGKTTCAYFHPTGDRVMYSSTHLDPKWSEKAKQEYEQRKQKVQQKYSWSYDESFDIFEKNLRTGKITNLTKTLGYDAEGDYSPDGKWIVFASNRAGYTESLTQDQKKLFQQDPSWMMDIYKMRSDGSQIQRLTTAPGYDGGPFFSADGKKITWRHFSEDGQKAEIWVMNADGSEQKQITHSGVMSWSPFFHPSGKYIIYTSNLLGFQNFELFIVDVEGKHEPVRVTFLDGFDGLPVFTPDGQKLSWTRRNEKGDSQIYWADWNHEKALELLEMATELPKKLSAGWDSKNFEKWVTYLAGPQFAGRKNGIRGRKSFA
jgi:Tol biopolymer transport system component